MVSNSDKIKMLSSNFDRVRILVVGDAGVGKTSLVHLISQCEPILNPYWTIGCSVEVKLHDYKAGTPFEKTYFLELWDVGGWSSHQSSRSVFYNPVHGIILVHDLTNKKSQQNLRKWLSEVLNRDAKDPADECDYDAEQFVGSSVPILVVGTKLDLVPPTTNGSAQRGFSIAEECGADEINLDCTHVRHLAAGTSNAVRLSRFFDKVIERKYPSRDTSAQNLQSDRRRPLSAYSKFMHAD
jgi:Rab-like protein 3